MDLTSYGFSQRDLVYRWKKDPIERKSVVDEGMLSYQLKSINTSDCTETTRTGWFPLYTGGARARHLTSHVCCQGRTVVCEPRWC